MNYNKARKSSTIVFIFLWVTYCLTTMSKMAFSSAMPSIINDGLLTKSQAGAISSVYWVVYTLGQVCGGFIADKFKPEKLIVLGIFGTASVCAVFPFVGEFIPMLVVWGLFGFIQFGLWPATVVILSKGILKEHMEKAHHYITFPYCVGTALSYAFASALSKFGWQTLFIVNAAIELVLAILFIIAYLRHGKPLYEYIDKYDFREVVSGKAPKSDIKNIGHFLKNGLAVMIMISLVRATLSTGLTTWVPTMLIETKGVATTLSLIFTILVLISNFFGIYPAEKILSYHKGNEMKTLAAMYAVAFPFISLLLLRNFIPVAVIVIMLMIVTTISYSCGSVILSQSVSYRYTKYNFTGTSAGLINAGAALGNVISIFGYGVLIDSVGWTKTIIIWICLAAFVVITALLSKKTWTRFIEEN